MIRFLRWTIVLTMFALNVPIARGEARTPHDAQTRFITTESLLAITVGQVHHTYEGDDLFVKRFDASQDAWREYREAQLRALFPDVKVPRKFGADLSEQELCWLQAMETLTQRRIDEINVWLSDGKKAAICSERPGSQLGD